MLGGDSCFMAVNVWSTGQKKIEIENSGLDKFKCSDSSTKMSCKCSKASRTTFHCCCTASSVFRVFPLARKRRIQKLSSSVFTCKWKGVSGC